MARRTGLSEEKCAAIILLRAAEQYRREQQIQPPDIGDGNPMGTMQVRGTLSFGVDAASEDGDESAIIIQDGDGEVGEGITFSFDYDSGGPEPQALITHYRALRRARESHVALADIGRTEWQLHPETLMRIVEGTLSEETLLICSGWPDGYFSMPQHEHMIVPARLRAQPVPGANMMGLALEEDIVWTNETGSDVALSSFALHSGEIGDVAYLRLNYPHVVPPLEEFRIQTSVIANVS